MIVIEQTAESFTACDITDCASDFVARLNDLTGEHLVISLGVVVSQEFANGILQGALAEEDPFIEALGFWLR